MEGNTETVLITFEIQAPDALPEETVFISGSCIELGMLIVIFIFFKKKIFNHKN